LKNEKKNRLIRFMRRQIAAVMRIVGDVILSGGYPMRGLVLRFVNDQSTTMAIATGIALVILAVVNGLGVELNTTL
jgi:hypothetical protein